MSYALFSNVSLCRMFSIHELPNDLFQTSSGRPPHIIGRLANTVSLWRVQAPNDHAPFRVHDAFINFVDQ